MEQVKLTDICKPKQWKTIPTNDLLKNGFPVYGANGVIGYYKEYNHKDSVVTITCRGATCGTVNIAEPKSYITGNAMCLDNLRQDIMQKYLYYYLSNYDFTNVISGSAQPQITRQGLEKVVISIGTKEEQTTIVALLDKVNSIIDARQQQLAKLDELVKARFVEIFGDPMINSMHWPIYELSEYIQFLTSGSRGWAKYFTDEGEYFITIKNVKNCKTTLDDVQHIAPPDNAEAKRTKVQAGDLLISITADLGRTGVVTQEIAEHGAYINQHLTCIRLNQSVVLPLYVAYYMESDAGKKQFQLKNQTGVKAGLNFNSINTLKVMVPPLEKQRSFVSFVEQVEKTKSSIQKNLKKIEILKKALVQRYFG